MIGIARREGIDYRRRMARQRRRFAPLVDDPVQAHNKGAQHESDLVRQAIRELPERERLAVHIHYLCGQPAETARQCLGLSPSGFYKLLDRARSRLRTRLLNVENRR
jgi:DNA-directed RNA polymerase specialized sigma24 family protein